ncbi:reverse transcriptase domain-containing protein [Tanacetum coccineum]
MEAQEMAIWIARAICMRASHCFLLALTTIEFSVPEGGPEEEAGFFQISIAPEDQEKTTFTCPYGTFAYRRMPFGLCNGLATFQRCMTAIFHDMVKDFMEVFMDDVSVFDYVNYIVRKVVPLKWTSERRKWFFSQARNNFWDKPYAFRLCPDNVMRRCMAGDEILEILAHCHSGRTRGHHSTSIIRRKVYEAGFYMPSIFKDAKDYVMKCDACQKSGNISSQSEMPQNNIQVCEVFDVWGLDFMGPFPGSRGNKYILVAVDYVSKWVEAQALLTNNAHVVVKFLKGLFARFRVLKTLISEIEHKAYWALKQANMDLTAAVKNRFMKLNELMELRDGAYENTRIYKERTKIWHDSRLRGDLNFKMETRMQYGVSLGLGYGILTSCTDLVVRKSTIWYTLKKTCVDLVGAF